MILKCLILLLAFAAGADARERIAWGDNNWADACDFPVNDLNNEPTPNMFDCITKCKNTPGCTHFTWTTLNGGTCFMKEGPVTMSDAEFTGECSMMCGVGFVWEGNTANGCYFEGNDIGNATTGMYECNQKCLDTPSCTHYTWTTDNGGTCWMMEGPATEFDAISSGDYSMVCGVAVRRIIWNGTIANGCYFEGEDLSNEATDMYSCSAKCEETSQCTHFTWTKDNGGTCWMKKGPVSESDAVPSDDYSMICGIGNNQILWHQYYGNWAYACDFIGNDLDMVQVPGRLECRKNCKNTAGCTHTTWTADNGGTCRMKKGAVSKSDATYTGDDSMVCEIGDGRVFWRGNWGRACDFKGNDLNIAHVPAKACGETCEQTPGCTHFTWTTNTNVRDNFMYGTCRMMSGRISKNDYFYNGNCDSLCGIVNPDEGSWMCTEVYSSIYRDQRYSNSIFLNFPDGHVFNETIFLSPSSGTTAIQTFIYNMKGISSEMTGNMISIKAQKAVMGFFKSSFDLFDETGAIIDAGKCSADYFESRDVGYFRNMGNFKIEIALGENYFRRPLCPYLFKNARIQLLTLVQLEDDFLEHNHLTFYNIHNPSNLTINLNVSIYRLSFTGTRCGKLNQQFYDNYKHIWPKTDLSIECGFYFIETGFFRNYHGMTVQLRIVNSRKFYHSSNNEWLSSISYPFPIYGSRNEILKSTDDTTLIHSNLIIANVPYYDYPDEDFCLFQYFPRQKAIYYDDPYVVDLHYHTCTLRFLTQYNLVICTISSLRECKFTFSETLLEECEFENRLSLCSNFSSYLVSGEDNYMTPQYNAFYIFNWMEFIGPVVTLPIFAVVALILNLITILVIRSKKNKKEKLFDSKIFKLIEMNSVFIFIECLLFQFKLLGVCLGPNSIFCPNLSLLNSSFVYSFLSCILYLNEALKSSSLIAELLFSVQRYAEATKTENALVKWLSNVKMIFLYLFAIGYGLGVSWVVFFNISSFGENPDPFNLPVMVKLRPEQFNSQKTGTIMYFSYFFTNDLLIIIINLIVDIRLVRFIKRNLREKLENKFKDKIKLSKQDEIKLQEEKKKKKTTERKANAMIFISVCVYILCRLPELFGVIAVYYINDNFVDPIFGCISTPLCSFIASTTQYFYLISYNFNIIIYYNFNSNFKKGLRNFFNVKSAETKK